MLGTQPMLDLILARTPARLLFILFLPSTDLLSTFFHLVHLRLPYLLHV